MARLQHRKENGEANRQYSSIITPESHQVWPSSGNSILLTFYFHVALPSFQLVLQTDC